MRTVPFHEIQVFYKAGMFKHNNVAMLFGPLCPNEASAGCDFLSMPQVDGMQLILDLTMATDTKC